MTVRGKNTPKRRFKINLAAGHIRKNNILLAFFLRLKEQWIGPLKGILYEGENLFVSARQ